MTPFDNQEKKKNGCPNTLGSSRVGKEGLEYLSARTKQKGISMSPEALNRTGRKRRFDIMPGEKYQRAVSLDLRLGTRRHRKDHSAEAASQSRTLMN